MPVEYQDSTTFPRPNRGMRGQWSWRLWAKESRSSLPKPPEVHSQHPPQDQFHVPAGTEGMAWWILAFGVTEIRSGNPPV